MNTAPTRIYRAADVRELDRIAIEEVGIAGYTLMSRAGRGAFETASQRWPEARRWLVVCGAGNNAGDGYVVAHAARAAGLDVTVAALTDPAGLRGDAARAFDDFRAAGGQAQAMSALLADEADVIVDAVLGTGLDRAVAGGFKSAIDALNAAPAKVLALDIPSGLNADTGAVMGCAVHADLTVTFVGYKLGLFVGAGPALRGDFEWSMMISW